MNFNMLLFLRFSKGDSTGEPTEDDVVKDALYSYELIENHAPMAKIYIWGHSLGTGYF